MGRFLIPKTISRSNREQTKFPAFLRWIREQPCTICGKQSEAAHVRYSDAKYKKFNSRDDKWTVPLCPGHHRLYPDAQHNSGEQDWWDARGIDPLKIAKKLWEDWNAKSSLE